MGCTMSSIGSRLTASPMRNALRAEFSRMIPGRQRTREIAEDGDSRPLGAILGGARSRFMPWGGIPTYVGYSVVVSVSDASFIAS